MTEIKENVAEIVTRKKNSKHLMKGQTMKKTDMTRRNFIKSGIAASAVFSIPTIVPSTVF